MPKYTGFYMDKPRVEIEAPTLYAAKTKAVEHFKPSKKNSGMCHVVLTENRGQPVMVQNSNADFG